MILRLNNADIQKVCARDDLSAPNGKHDKSDIGYHVDQGDGEMLLFASRKPLPSETQARGFTKAQLVFFKNASFSRTRTACQTQEIVPDAITTNMRCYCLPGFS